MIPTYSLALSICLMSSSMLDAFAFWQHHRAAHAYRNGDCQTAQGLWDDLMCADQHDTQAIYNRAKVAYDQREYAQAEAYFEHVARAEEAPTQLRLQGLFDKGNAQVKQKKYCEALESYQQVIELDQEHEAAQDMIEQLKKTLEQQRQQKQQEEQEKQKQQEQQNEGDNGKKQNQQNDKQSGQSKSSESGQEKQEEQSSQGNNEQSEPDGAQEESGSSEQESQQNNEQSDQRKQQQGPENQPHNKKQEQERADKQQGAAGDDSSQKPGQKTQDTGENQQEARQQQEGHDQSSENEQSKTSHPGVSSVEDSNKENGPAMGQSGTDEKQEDGEDAYLFKLLDERDASQLKQMLHMNLKKEMPGKHGQKNW